MILLFQCKLKMITELLLICVIIIILRLFVFKSKTQKLLDQIPGPKHYPLVGNIFDFNYPKEGTLIIN